MPEIIAKFNYRHEAEFARGFLEDAGIPASVFVDDAGGIEAGMAFSNPSRVMVPDEYAARGRKVLPNAGVLE